MDSQQNIAEGARGSERAGAVFVVEVAEILGNAHERKRQYPAHPEANNGSEQNLSEALPGKYVGTERCFGQIAAKEPRVMEVYGCARELNRCKGAEQSYPDSQDVDQVKHRTLQEIPHVLSTLPVVWCVGRRTIGKQHTVRAGCTLVTLPVDEGYYRTDDLESAEFSPVGEPE